MTTSQFLLMMIAPISGLIIGGVAVLHTWLQERSRSR